MGSQADRRRYRCGGGQRRHRVEPWPIDEVTPTEMIVSPRVVEAELFGAHPESPSIRPAVLGQDHDPEPQPQVPSIRSTTVTMVLMTRVGCALVCGGGGGVDRSEAVRTGFGTKLVPPLASAASATTTKAPLAQGFRL